MKSFQCGTCIFCSRHLLSTAEKERQEPNLNVNSTVPSFLPIKHTMMTQRDRTNCQEVQGVLKIGLLQHTHSGALQVCLLSHPVPEFTLQCTAQRLTQGFLTDTKGGQNWPASRVGLRHGSLGPLLRLWVKGWGAPSGSEAGVLMDTLPYWTERALQGESCTLRG